MIIKVDNEDGDMNFEFPLEMKNGRIDMKVWISEDGVGLKFRLHHNAAEMLFHQKMYVLSVDGNRLMLRKYKNGKLMTEEAIDSL